MLISNFTLGPWLVAVAAAIVAADYDDDERWCPVAKFQSRKE